jgi:hypothetical protein
LHEPNEWSCTTSQVICCATYQLVNKQHVRDAQCFKYIKGGWRWRVGAGAWFFPKAPEWPVTSYKESQPPPPLPNLICGFMKFPCPQQYPQIFKESPGYTVQQACSELKHSRLLLINLFLNSANEISCAEKTPPPYIIFVYIRPTRHDLAHTHIPKRPHSICVKQI